MYEHQLHDTFSFATATTQHIRETKVKSNKFIIILCKNKSYHIANLFVFYEKKNIFAPQ